MAPAREQLARLAGRVSPRVADVAVIVVGVFLTVAGSDGPNAWSPFPRPVAVAAGVVGSVALWWRRQRPDEVAYLNVVALALSANPVPALVAFYSAGAASRRAWALAGIVVGGAFAYAVPEWVDAGGVTWPPVLPGILLAAAPVGLGLYARTRHDLMASLRDRAAGAEAGRELRAEQARLGERARIAREMHDVLAHKVSLIALHAGALEVNPDSGPDRVEEVAGVIRTTAVQALEELRSVLGVLRQDGPADVLAPQPQAVDIQRLVETSRAAGLPADIDADVGELPDGVARAAYRVVQEALTNVHKHAAGARTVVSLTGDRAAGLTVTVENEPALPTGSAPPTGPDLPGSGAGLVGLQERMRLLDGTLTYGPRPDGGWRVLAWVPWSGDREPLETVGDASGAP
jgi:signal transduction histidine kinase